MNRRPVRDVPLAVRQIGAAALRVRGPVALTRFLRSDVLAGEGVPHGDGEPVVVLPPAVAGDWLMPIMVGWLGRIGYTGYRSSIRLHVDCSDRTLSKVLQRVEEIADRHDRKVILVGHSRGGLLARALAGARPDLVERVVAVASPLNEPFAVTNLTLAAAARVARNRLQNGDPVRLNMGCMTEACACTYGRFFRAPLQGPPLISLFTRNDEIVRWQSCLAEAAHNIEIGGSHVGVLTSRSVYDVIAHALTGELDAPGITWIGPPSGTTGLVPDQR